MKNGQVTGEQMVESWLKTKTNKIISYSMLYNECKDIPKKLGQKIYSPESWSRFFRTVRERVLFLEARKFERRHVKGSREMHWKVVKL